MALLSKAMSAQLSVRMRTWRLGRTSFLLRHPQPLIRLKLLPAISPIQSSSICSKAAKHLSCQPPAWQNWGTSLLSFLAIYNEQRSEEHTSELQSPMRISYAVFCLTKNKNNNPHQKN